MSTYTHEEKSAIWWKAKPIMGLDPKKFQQDQYGNKIAWHEYGKMSQNGWEIDHKHPQSKGGSDQLINLQPLHWLANRRKSDSIQ